MNMEYEIVREFDTNGKHMVIVKIGENAHVMDESELRWDMVVGILRDGRREHKIWK